MANGKRWIPYPQQKSSVGIPQIFLQLVQSAGSKRESWCLLLFSRRSRLSRVWDCVPIFRYKPFPQEPGHCSEQSSDFFSDPLQDDFHHVPTEPSKSVADPIHIRCSVLGPFLTTRVALDRIDSPSTLPNVCLRVCVHLPFPMCARCVCMCMCSYARRMLSHLVNSTAMNVCSLHPPRRYRGVLVMSWTMFAVACVCAACVFASSGAKDTARTFFAIHYCSHMSFPPIY